MLIHPCLTLLYYGKTAPALQNFKFSRNVLYPIEYKVAASWRMYSMTSFTRKSLSFAINQHMALYQTSNILGKGIIYLKMEQKRVPSKLNSRICKLRLWNKLSTYEAAWLGEINIEERKIYCLQQIFNIRCPEFAASQVTEKCSTTAPISPLIKWKGRTWSTKKIYKLSCTVSNGENKVRWAPYPSYLPINALEIACGSALDINLVVVGLAFIARNFTIWAELTKPWKHYYSKYLATEQPVKRK